MTNDKSKVNQLLDLFLNKEAPTEQPKEEISPEQQRIAELEARIAQLEKSPGAVPTGNVDQLPQANITIEDAIQAVYDDVIEDLRIHKQPRRLNGYEATIYSLKKLGGMTNTQVAKALEEFNIE